MSSNIEQFSFYTMKVFDLLYESFPIPDSISKQDVIAEYLTFDNQKKLKELKIQKGMASIVEFSDDAELKNRYEVALPNIESRHDALENDEIRDKEKQENIYEGTIVFLIAEHFIRECEYGGYQLTSKSFSHLNKVFSDGEIKSSDKSYIENIKVALSSSSIDVVKGTAISVITNL